MLHSKKLCVLWALPGIVASAWAQDGDRDEAEPAAEDAAGGIVEYVDTEPERCLNVQSIRRTEIIDDSTIAFHLRSRKIYVNQLPQTCPGLKRNDRFMYRVHTTQLCNSDTITVLEPAIGGIGVGTPGFTCRLGDYFESTEAYVALLKEGGDARGGRAAVKGKPIELPPEDEAQPSEETQDE